MTRPFQPLRTGRTSAKHASRKWSAEKGVSAPGTAPYATHDTAPAEPSSRRRGCVWGPRSGRPCVLRSVIIIIAPQPTCCLGCQESEKKCAAPHWAPLPTEPVPPRCRDTKGIDQGPQGRPPRPRTGPDGRSGARDGNPGTGNGKGLHVIRSPEYFRFF